MFVEDDELPINRTFVAHRCLSHFSLNNDYMTKKDSDSKTDSSLLPKVDEEVFISYSRKDQNIVRDLQSALTEQGCQAWVDWTGIPPAGDWLETIQTAIDRAQVFLFVI